LSLTANVRRPRVGEIDFVRRDGHADLRHPHAATPARAASLTAIVPTHRVGMTDDVFGRGLDRDIRAKASGWQNSGLAQVLSAKSFRALGFRAPSPAPA